MHAGNEKKIIFWHHEIHDPILFAVASHILLKRLVCPSDDSDDSDDSTTLMTLTTLTTLTTDDF